MLGAAALALLGLAVDAGAERARVGGRVYECEPETAAQRVPVPAPPAGGPARLAWGRFAGTAVCPAGQLPAPRVLRVRPPHPPAVGDGARAAAPAAGPQEQFGADYYYAVGATSRLAESAITGFAGEAETEEEAVDSAAGEGHSVTQLWGLDETLGANRFSDIELGTISAPSLNAGAPTLFVYHFDEGEPTCYDGCGYVQLGNVAGRVPGYPLEDPAPLLTPGAPHRYAILEEKLEGKWFVEVDGETVGYFPASAWPRSAPTVLTTEEAGGEVETPVAEPDPHTTMGDGAAGAGGASAAAPSTGPTYWRSTAERRALGKTFTPVALSPFASEPAVYSVGPYTGPKGEAPGAGFAFGGPGWCGGASPICPAPGVTLSGATAVAPTAATLAGAVDPRGTASGYWFEYATAPLGGWASTPAASAGQGSAALGVSATVGSLQPSTPYRFRLAAENANGVERSALGSFTTPAAPPAAAGPAGGVSRFSTSQPPTPLHVSVLRIREHGGALTVRISVTRRCTVSVSGRGLHRFVRSLAAGTHVVTVQLTRLGRISARHRRTLVVRISAAAGASVVAKTVRVRS